MILPVASAHALQKRLCNSFPCWGRHGSSTVASLAMCHKLLHILSVHADEMAFASARTCAQLQNAIFGYSHVGCTTSPAAQPALRLSHGVAVTSIWSTPHFQVVAQHCCLGPGPPPACTVRCPMGGRGAASLCPFHHLVLGPQLYILPSPPLPQHVPFGSITTNSPTDAVAALFRVYLLRSVLLIRHVNTV